MNWSPLGLQLTDNTGWPSCGSISLHMMYGVHICWIGDFKQTRHSRAKPVRRVQHKKCLWQLSKNDVFAFTSSLVQSKAVPDWKHAKHKKVMLSASCLVKGTQVSPECSHITLHSIEIVDADGVVKRAWKPYIMGKNVFSTFAGSKSLKDGVKICKYKTHTSMKGPTRF